VLAIVFILTVNCSTVLATSLVLAAASSAVLAMEFTLEDASSVIDVVSEALDAVCSALLTSWLLTADSSCEEPAKLSESVRNSFKMVWSLEARESTDLESFPNSSPRLSPVRWVMSPFSILSRVPTTFFNGLVTETVKNIPRSMATTTTTNKTTTAAFTLSAASAEASSESLLTAFTLWSFASCKSFNALSPTLSKPSGNLSVFIPSGSKALARLTKAINESVKSSVMVITCCKIFFPSSSVSFCWSYMELFRVLLISSRLLIILARSSGVLACCHLRAAIRSSCTCKAVTTKTPKGTAPVSYITSVALETFWRLSIVYIPIKAVRAAKNRNDAINFGPILMFFILAPRFKP